MAILGNGHPPLFLTPMKKEETPHYKGHRERLKQKFVHSGVETFYDYEVLELLLFYAIPQKDVKSLAKNLLKTFGGIRHIVDADIDTLITIPGISAHTAVLIKLIKEIGALYLKEAAKEKTQISCTTELLNYCKTMLGGLKDEQFCVIYLDAQNQLIGMETLQEGIVNQAVVYPRQVLENALRQKASAMILVHNHPSGHVKPSDADIRLTKTIQEAARVLEILVHDHIIVGENRFFSFREEGIMTSL
jgi:DNA repair protein RadC